MAKRQRSLNVLKVLTRVWWGGHPKSLLIVYRALIRPHLENSCFHWANISQKLMNDLNKIQYQALRICLGAMKSTPLPCLLAEASEPPLSLRFKFLAQKYVLKLFENKNENVISKFYYLATQNLDNHQYWRCKNIPFLAEAFCDLSDTRRTCSFMTIFDISFPELLTKPFVLPVLNYTEIIAYNLALINEVLNKFNFRNSIYTDASKSSDGVGAGLYFPQLDLELSFNLPSFCSIYSAEIIAIVEALDYNIIDNNQIENFVICTDSLSAILMLCNLNFKSKITNFYIFRILSLTHKINTRGKRVSFL